MPTAERQKQLDAMSDAQIRDLLIGAMAADPTAGVSRRDAECIVGYLGQQGVGEFQRSVHGPGHDDRCC